MSRPLRIEYEGAWYHVMNRGRHADRIFEDANDYQMFIDFLKDTSELWDVRISAYCLMSNHYQLFRGRFKSILRGYSPGSSALAVMEEKIRKSRNVHKRYEKIKNSLQISQTET